MNLNPFAKSNNQEDENLKNSNSDGIGLTDEAATEDMFGITSYVEGLTNFISKCNTPLTISIQGSWGTGKTSIMNLIKNQLPADVYPVWFNTWQFSQFNMSEQLPVSLLSSLLTAFQLKDKNTLESVNKIIKTLGFALRVTKGATIAALDHFYSGFVASMAKAAIDGGTKEFNKSDDESDDLDISNSIKNLKNEFIKCVEQTLKEKKMSRIVIFIDDLDRLNPGKAVELLEVLKLFLDCKNCVFVLAIDYDVVCRGVHMKYGSLDDDKMAAADKGRSFFDKIIQVPFKMPVAKYKIDDYVKACFKQIGLDFNNDKDINVYIELIKCSIGTNPRAMKRLFNAFQLLLEIVRIVGATEKNDLSSNLKNRQLLFAILCLNHCSEPIYNFIILNKEKLTLEMFESLINDDYEHFVEKAKNGGAETYGVDSVEFESVKPFLLKLKEAIDLNESKDISTDELDKFKEIMYFTSITNASETGDDTTVKRKKISFIYNNQDIYESGNRKGFNIGNLGHRIIKDVAEKYNWTSADAEKFRGEFLSKGSTGWLNEVIMFSNEVKALSEDYIEDMGTNYSGVKRVACISRFKDHFFSYMSKADNSYEERLALDDTKTVKLTDGTVFFVARYWGVSDIDRLKKILKDVFGYTILLEQIS